MKISNEQDLINHPSVTKIKMINKKYQKIKIARNQCIALAGVTFGLAAADAIAQKGLMTVFMGGASLICMKAAELTINAIRTIKPQYKEILARAKNINKIRQNMDILV